MIIELRKQFFQERINQIVQESKRQSFFAIVIFTVYTILLIRYWRDLRDVYEIEPKTVFYCVISTAQFGLEFLVRTYAIMFYTLEIGVKTCMPEWIYTIGSISFNIWGCSFIFKDSYELKSGPRNQKTIYVMTSVMAIIRFMGTVVVLVMLFLVFTSSFLPYLCLKDKGVKRRKKLELELFFVYLMPCNGTSKIILRNYRE